MPPIVRELIATVAALFVGAAGVFVVADSITGNWVQFAVRPPQHEWLTGSETGVAVAAIAAVLACALVAQYGSRRSAWVVVALCTAAVIAVTLLARSLDSVGFLTTVQLLRCVVAGGMLGGAAAVVTGRAPAQRTALIAGTLMAFVFALTRDRAPHRVNFAFVEKHQFVNGAALENADPLWWLVIGALVLAIAAAWTTKAGYRLQRPDVQTTRIAVVAAITLALANRLLGEWVQHQYGNHQFLEWLVIGVSVAVVLIIVELTALAVSPVDGRFLLVATGLTAAIFPVVIDISGPQRSVSTGVLIAAALVSLVFGGRIAMTRKHPFAGLLVAVLVALLTALAPDWGNDGSLLVLRLVVLGLAAGYALSSTFPAEASVAALGLGIPFTAMVFGATAKVAGTYVVYDAAYEPLRGVHMTTAQSSAIDTAISRADSDHRFAAISLLIAAILCAVGAITLRQRREPPPPERSGGIRFPGFR